MSRGAACVLVLAVLLSTPLGAHNNASVHPEITDVAIALVRKLDRTQAGESDPGDLYGSCDDCEYAELWENGRDGLRPISDAGDHEPYTDAYRAGDASVVIGVVIEDGTGLPYTGLPGPTIIRVISHFYHVRTGNGLLFVNQPSRDRAGENFDFGVRLFDYTPESQERAYIYLGRFLHHVQDMSSPAHVHDDPHVPLLFAENDDYEGVYVPETLWEQGQLRGILEGQTTAVDVTSAQQIWPDPPTDGILGDDASLAGFVYNRSLYQAVLEFPFGSGGGPDPVPSGELQLMFPDETDDFFNDGLHWDDGTLFGIPSWEIDGVGSYYYQLDWGVDEQAWWGEFPFPAVIHADGLSSYYYIEDLIEDPLTVLQSGDTVIPSRHREFYEQLYDPATNDMVINNKCAGGSNDATLCFDDGDCEGGGSCAFGLSMLERQRDALLEPAVAYTAGAARWWFQVANNPPFLQEVTATQHGATRYHGKWDDVIVQESYTHTEELGDTVEEVPIVLRRIFDHQPWERRYINEAGSLTLELRFNEPVKEITTLALVDDNGALIWDMMSDIAGQTSNAMPDVSMEGDVWTYTLLAETIDAAPAGIDGDRILHVHATDRNPHFGDGAELDGNPETPAKRQLFSNSFVAGSYPWHSETSDERFVYEFQDGDRNHRLLIDTEGPNTTVTIEQD